MASYFRDFLRFPALYPAFSSSYNFFTDMVFVVDARQCCELSFTKRNFPSFYLSRFADPRHSSSVLPVCSCVTDVVLVTYVRSYCELGFVLQRNLVGFIFAALCGSRSFNQRSCVTDFVVIALKRTFNHTVS